MSPGAQISSFITSSNLGRRSNMTTWYKEFELTGCLVLLGKPVDVSAWDVPCMHLYCNSVLVTILQKKIKIKLQFCVNILLYIYIVCLIGPSLVQIFKY